MLRVDSRSTNYNASVLDENEIIAYLSASRSGNSVSMSVSFNDITKYTELNAARVKEDIGALLDRIAAAGEVVPETPAAEPEESEPEEE